MSEMVRKGFLGGMTGSLKSGKRQHHSRREEVGACHAPGWQIMDEGQSFVPQLASQTVVELTWGGGYRVYGAGG